MGLYSKLKQDFLAALPVIGPHADIERELLLGHVKPITYKTVYSDDTVFYGWREKKDHIDRKILDQAVAEGRLKSTDLQVINKETGDVSVIRHYCRPDKEEDMDIVVLLHDMAWNNKRPVFLSFMGTLDMGQLLGYRKRDAFFFHYYDSLPLEIKRRILNLNTNSQYALSWKLLQRAGVDINQWFDDYQKLRAEFE